MSEKEYKEILKNNFNFWGRLTKAQQEFVLANIYTAVYKKGEIIYDGENGCIGVAFIKSGGLRVYLVSDNMKEVTLYRLSKKDICVFSALCVLRLVTFDVTIEVEQDSELVVINLPAFEKISKENVYVDLFAHKITAERFSDVMWSMQQILFMSFDRRLAIFLYDETVKNKSMEINLTHEQVAKHLGTAREVITRMLKYFANEKIVEIVRKKIIVTDRTKLKKLTL